MSKIISASTSGITKLLVSGSTTNSIHFYNYSFAPLNFNYLLVSGGGANGGGGGGFLSGGAIADAGATLLITVGAGDANGTAPTAIGGNSSITGLLINTTLSAVSYGGGAGCSNGCSLEKI